MLSPSLEVLSWSRHLSSNNWCELLGALRCQDVRGLHPCPGLHITLLAPHLPLQVACAEGPTGNGNSAAVLFLEVIASYRGQSTPAENTGEAPSCGKFLASRAVKAALLTRINIQPKWRWRTNENSPATLWERALGFWQGAARVHTGFPFKPYLTQGLIWEFTCPFFLVCYRRYGLDRLD